jgi:transcriptional regulator with XRE-family HTH domain
MAKQPISDAARIFGERIRARRNALGKSQEQLALETDIHWSYLGQIERGQRNLTLHSILKLAEILDIETCELIKDLRAP